MQLTNNHKKSMARIGRSEMTFHDIGQEDIGAIVVDIETTPIAGALSKYFDPDSVKLGNVKDPEKVEAKVKEALERFEDKAALSPVLARIVSIGFYGQGFPQPAIKTAQDEEGERSIIAEFFHVFKAMPHVKCVTYNGLKFDLPFIWKRALMLNVRNEPSINFFQFRRRVVDIYLERNFGLYMSDLPTFDPDCSLTGRSFAEGVVSERRAEACEGRQYGEYVMSKDPDKVQMAHNHLIADLEETMELYQKDPSLRL